MPTFPLQFDRTDTADARVTNSFLDAAANPRIRPHDGPNVLLASTSNLPMTARLTMEFARAGARVTLLGPYDHAGKVITTLSCHLTYHALRPLTALQNAIRQVEPDIIVPSDERTVRHLHWLHAVTDDLAVRHLIERSIGPADSFALTTTRHDLLMVARDLGVRVPESASLASLSDLRAWAARQPGPWVVKADGSWAGFGVRVVAGLSEAETAWRALARPVSGMHALRETLLEKDLFWWRPWLKRVRPAMSVQSFVDGWPANCAVACWQGEVLAGVAAEAVSTQSSTGPSTIARIIEGPEMLDAAGRVVGALGLSGFVGFDFMIEAATGLPYMIEMNPRTTPISTVRLGPQRDLVEALLAKVSGREVRSYTPVTQREIVVFFPHTWRQDPSSPYLHSAYHDVPWEEPALVRALMRPEIRDRYWMLRTLRRAMGKTPPKRTSLAAEAA